MASFSLPPFLQQHFLGPQHLIARPGPGVGIEMGADAFFLLPVQFVIQERLDIDIGDVLLTIHGPDFSYELVTKHLRSSPGIGSAGTILIPDRW